MEIKIRGIEDQVKLGQDETGQQDETSFRGAEYAKKLTELLSQEPAIDFDWCALERPSRRLYFSKVAEDIEKAQPDILIMDLGWGGDDDSHLERFASERELRQWIDGMDTENIEDDNFDDNFQGGLHFLKLLQKNENWKKRLWQQGRGIIVVTQYAPPKTPTYAHLARVTKELGADFLFSKETFGATPRSKDIEKLIALIVTLYNGGNLDELRTAFPIEDLSDEEFAEIIPPTIADILVVHTEEGMAIEPWIDLWAKQFNPQHIYPSYIRDVQGWDLFSKRVSYFLEFDKEQLLSPTAIIFHRINEFDSPEPSQFYELFCDRMWDLLRHTSEMNLGSKYIKKCHLIFTVTSEQRKDWAQLLPKKLADCIRTYRYRNDLRIEVLPIEPPIKWHEDRFQRYLRRNFKRLWMEIKETEPKSVIIEPEAIEKLRNKHTYQNLLSLDGAIQKATENYPGDAVNVRITKDHIPETPPDRVMDQAAKQWPKSIEEGQAYVRRVVVKQLLTQVLTGFNNYLLLAESGVTQSAINEMKSQKPSLNEISFRNRELLIEEKKEENQTVRLDKNLDELTSEYSLFVDSIFAMTLLQEACKENQPNRMTLFEAAYQIDPYNPIIIDEYLKFLKPYIESELRWRELIISSAKDYNDFRIIITDAKVFIPLFWHWLLGFETKLISKLRFPLVLPQPDDLYSLIDIYNKVLT